MPAKILIYWLFYYLLILNKQNKTKQKLINPIYNDVIIAVLNDKKRFVGQSNMFYENLIS